VGELPIYDRVVTLDNQISRTFQISHWGGRGFNIVGVLVFEDRDDSEWFAFFLRRASWRERLKNWRNGFGVFEHTDISLFVFSGFPPFSEIGSHLIKVLNKLRRKVVNDDVLNNALSKSI
jgi:hypothetical protein